MSLISFEAPIRAVVFGAGGGIGSALVGLLAADPAVESVFAASRREIDLPAGAEWRRFALDDEASIAAIAAEAGPSLVIVATGLLHASGYGPEKAMSALDPVSLARAFEVNAIGPAIVAKHMLPRMPRAGRSVFAALSARVGSIGDNRLGGWHGYRASKAALNQLIRTLAIEWTRRAPEGLCVALHPGTVDTPLSKPFQAGVPAEKLFDTKYSAGALLAVLDSLEPTDSGGFFAWDGNPIPY